MKPHPEWKTVLAATLDQLTSMRAEWAAEVSAIEARKDRLNEVTEAAKEDLAQERNRAESQLLSLCNQIRNRLGL
jgi:outer membrane murein-binding lipoprotein Lpp